MLLAFVAGFVLGIVALPLLVWWFLHDERPPGGGWNDGE